MDSKDKSKPNQTDPLEVESIDELDPETQASIERGLDQVDREEGIPLDEFFALLRKKYPGTSKP